MLYRPNKKETKQIKALNKGYNYIKKGFALVVNNSPKSDIELGVYIYRTGKNIGKIIKRIAVLLEAQYIDREFFKIVNNKKRKK